MAKPKVQSLDQIMGELNTVYEPSRQNINKRLEALPGQFEADRQALTARKQNEFRDINDQAAGTGQAFSGIPIAEQARYLGEQYLPGQQRLVQQENDQTLEMEGLLDELLGSQRSRALDMRNEQKSTLQSFMEAERDRRFRAEEARKQREAQAQRDAANRAENRRLQEQENAPPEFDTRVKIAESNDALRQVAGGDGYVSPSDYLTARRTWVQAGGDPNGFDSFNWKFINPSHARDYTSNSSILSTLQSRR